jgi:uncharacterized protein (TIGR02147 family)
MANARPDIFSYADYRTFLKDRYTILKRENRQFSHRYISTKVRASSAGWFSDVISGRINVTAGFIDPLAAVFKLTGEETEFFRSLVNCNQTKNLAEKSRFLELLITTRKTEAITVSRDRFMYYSIWYIPVIRELLFFYDFSGNYRALSRMVRPAIRVSEARKAVDILTGLGFVSPDENGFLKPKDAILRKESGFASIHWANFQKSALELATAAIERFRKEERDISSVLVCLSPASFAIAREEIARLRKRILELSEADRARDTVYQCNFQIFPTSQSSETSRPGGPHA